MSVGRCRALDLMMSCLAKRAVAVPSALPPPPPLLLLRPRLHHHHHHRNMVTSTRTRLAAASGGGGGTGGFAPERVAVVTKTTRYEFELQRYRLAGLSEEDLKTLLAMKGSSYSGLLERHNIHTRNVAHVVSALRDAGVDVRVVRRQEYDQDTVQWADAIVSAGGDGTMLLVAGKVFDKDTPVIGVNTDPEKSEGHLCLPVRYTHAFPEALAKLARGQFRWLWRQRSRLYLEGTGINPTPVDLHEMQLSLEQHSQAHRITKMNRQYAHGTTHNLSSSSEPHLLPVRSLNEIFIGESLSSKASYYEMSVDNGPWEKQKSSGLSVATGTGSRAWSYNINKLGRQTVEDVLRLGASLRPGGPPRRDPPDDPPLDTELVERVMQRYNAALVFQPDDRRLFFSVREPIVNRVFSASQQRGFAARQVCVRSRCWDACMVVDSGTSFEFNDGAVATITMRDEDALRTVLLQEDP